MLVLIDLRCMRSRRPQVRSVAHLVHQTGVEIFPLADPVDISHRLQLSPLNLTGREHSGSVGCHAKRGSLDFRQIWLVERYLCTLKDRHRCAVDVRPPYFVLEGVPDFGAVGRLDLDTSGVLIFTDDGRLKRAISSPQ